MSNQPTIEVIGVGGGGGNAVGAMAREGIGGVGFAVANTDAQALAASPTSRRIHLGRGTTGGRGAGGDPAIGQQSARASAPELAETLQQADMVFVTAGLGGGTGTGAAAVIAETAREQGALTVGVVTTPFPFEGRRRARHAEIGLAALEAHVDALLVIPNDRLLEVAGDDLSMLDAFAQADAVLCDAVRGISELVTHSGMVNVDFADVAEVMRAGGRTMMGIGRGRGRDRAQTAAEHAIRSPLLHEGSIEGAGAILLNFRAGPDLRLQEVHRAAAEVESRARDEAEVIFGVVQDPSMEDTLELTLVATGLGEPQPQDAIASSRDPQMSRSTHEPSAAAMGSAASAAPRNALRFLG